MEKRSATVRIPSLTRWDRTVPVVISGDQPETSAEDARRVLLALDSDIDGYRNLGCDDGCWYCEARIGGEWYQATMEDHYHESAAIAW